MTQSSYKPIAIKGLTEKDPDLLAAVTRLCKTAIWLKDHVSVDSEWDYKIGIPFSSCKKDIIHLAEMTTGIEAKNTYQGNLTVDELVREFSDFNDLLSSTYPLGKEDADFVITYGFLKGKLNFLKTVLSSVEKNKRPKNVERKIDWGMWGTVVGIMAILVSIVLAKLYGA